MKGRRMGGFDNLTTAQADSLILSRSEIFELSGYRRPSDQIKWLLAQGICHYVGSDGYPRVIRRALLQSIPMLPREPQLRL